MAMSERRLVPRTLRGRLAVWIGLSTLVSLVVFAVVAFMAALLVERAEDDPDDRETVADVRNEVLTAMAFAAPVGLALAAGGALWLTRRALLPVDQVIREAAAISADRLDRRLSVPDSEGELRELVVALNHLLERVERGHESLAAFAGDASHELRTPLAVIESELEVALRRPRTTLEWEASARTSLDELRRLARLVDALLRLSRQDAGPAAPAAPVDLGALVEDVIAGQAGAADRAGVTVAYYAADGELAVAADPDGLASAVGNLLANAIRYAPDGSEVDVALRRRDGRVTVRVDDRGPGLAPGEDAEVFAPFVRGQAGRAADAGDAPTGLGLGLAVARRAVERHGGTVTTAPRPGGGARFEIDLPLAGGDESSG
jgi:signal transduction histidine kinase